MRWWEGGRFAGGRRRSEGRGKSRSRRWGGRPRPYHSAAEPYSQQEETERDLDKQPAAHECNLRAELSARKLSPARSMCIRPLGWRGLDCDSPEGPGEGPAGAVRAWVLRSCPLLHRRASWRGLAAFVVSSSPNSPGLPPCSGLEAPAPMRCPGRTSESTGDLMDKPTGKWLRCLALRKRR